MIEEDIKRGILGDMFQAFGESTGFTSSGATSELKTEDLHKLCEEMNGLPKPKSILIIPKFASSDKWVVVEMEEREAVEIWMEVMRRRGVFPKLELEPLEIKEG